MINYMISNTGQIHSLSLDKNDCTKISGICHVDADCFANGTSFECKCKNGYTGDGKDCAGMPADKLLLTTAVRI